jgi:hypothetical protein
MARCMAGRVDGVGTQGDLPEAMLRGSETYLPAGPGHRPGACRGGIAVLNWTARNAEPSTARKAIILGNIVGFGVGPALDVWGLLSGARKLAAVFAVIHLLIASAFIWAWRASMSAKAS